MQTPDVQIRSATTDDVPLILRFIQELAAYERLSHEAVATEEALRRTLFGERPAAEVLLAELDGRAVGFALLFPNYSTFLAKPGMYLEDLFVSPEARGQGVGRRLLAEVAKRATERGCGRLEWSVLDWNEPAIEFYRSVGAEPLDQWTTFRMRPEAMAALAAGGRGSGGA